MHIEEEVENPTTTTKTNKYFNGKKEKETVNCTLYTIQNTEFMYKSITTNISAHKFGWVNAKEIHFIA